VYVRVKEKGRIRKRDRESERDITFKKFNMKIDYQVSISSKKIAHILRKYFSAKKLQSQT